MPLSSGDVIHTTHASEMTRNLPLCWYVSHPETPTACSGSASHASSLYRFFCILYTGQYRVRSRLFSQKRLDKLRDGATLSILNKFNDDFPASCDRTKHDIAVPRPRLQGSLLSFSYSFLRLPPIEVSLVSTMPWSKRQIGNRGNCSVQYAL